jgi:hypothetical protein
MLHEARGEARGERFADDETEALAFAGGEFKGLAGSRTPGHAPRFETGDDPLDARFPIKEDDVDGEAHEGGVHGIAGVEQEALARRQGRAEQETLEAREEGLGAADQERTRFEVHA